MPVQPSAPRHFSLAARSGATYPKDSPSGESPPLGRTRSASRHPFPLYPPFLPLPAPFVGGAKRRRVSKRFAVRRISPLGRTRSASRHPSLYARPAFHSPPLSLAARSVAAYPKDSPSGESLRFGWGGLSRRGPAPSLTPRLPSHAPPFPQPQRALGGGCREGGSPPDFPSCPAALPAGTGRFPLSTGTPSPVLFAPTAPAVPPPSARRKSLPFRPRTCARRQPSARPRPTGPGPSARRRRQPSACGRKAGPSRKRTHVRFRDSAPARLTGSPSRMP